MSRDALGYPLNGLIAKECKRDKDRGYIYIYISPILRVSSHAYFN